MKKILYTYYNNTLYLTYIYIHQIHIHFYVKCIIATKCINTHILFTIKFYVLFNCIICYMSLHSCTLYMETYHIICCLHFHHTYKGLLRKIPFLFMLLILCVNKGTYFTHFNYLGYLIFVLSILLITMSHGLQSNLRFINLIIVHTQYYYLTSIVRDIMLKACRYIETHVDTTQLYMLLEPIYMDILNKIQFEMYASSECTTIQLAHTHILLIHITLLYLIICVLLLLLLFLLILLLLVFLSCATLFTARMRTCTCNIYCTCNYSFSLTIQVYMYIHVHLRMSVQSKDKRTMFLLCVNMIIADIRNKINKNFVKIAIANYRSMRKDIYGVDSNICWVISFYPLCSPPLLNRSLIEDYIFNVLHIIKFTYIIVWWHSECHIRGIRLMTNCNLFLCQNCFINHVYVCNIYMSHEYLCDMYMVNLYYLMLCMFYPTTPILSHPPCCVLYIQFLLTLIFFMVGCILLQLPCNGATIGVFGCGVIFLCSLVLYQILFAQISMYTLFVYTLRVIYICVINQALLSMPNNYIELIKLDIMYTFTSSRVLLFYYQYYIYCIHVISYVLNLYNLHYYHRLINN